MQEEWRDLIDYEDQYIISNKGEIIRKIKLNKMKPQLRNKYLAVLLCKNGKVKHNPIHRLVARTFIDNPENKRCVNHIDCNKFNNNQENLEWVTDLENKKHAHENRLFYNKDGEYCNSKLKNDDILKIREMNKIGIKNKDIALMYNVTASNISKIVSGRNWKKLS